MASIDDIYAHQIEMSNQLGELVGQMQMHLESSQEERRLVRERLDSLEAAHEVQCTAIQDIRDRINKTTWGVAGATAVVGFLFTVGPKLLSLFQPQRVP